MLSAVALAATAAPTRHQFAVVFDGGSTGTRVYVYRYELPAPGAPPALPTLHAERSWNMKVKPGLSTFAGTPGGPGLGYMRPLLDFARAIVPAEQQRSAVLLLRATAGMRLVSPPAAQRIYDSLYEAVRTHGAFSPTRALFGTLSGEDEGVFGWLAVNHLLLQAHRIRPAQLGDVGALDLGGGSTQITFALPPEAVGTAAVEASLPGRSVRVFTRSHLGFGNKQVLAALTPAEASACLAAGANASWEPDKRWGLQLDGARQLHGRGAFAKCEAGVMRVLATNGAMGRGAQPAVAGHHFVAMSLFYYAAHFAQASGHLRGGSPSYAVRELRAAAAALCAEDGAALEHRMAGKDPLTPTEAIRWRCFDLTYASALLSRGYGFSDDATVDFLGEIDGNEVEWTRGALLSHLATEERSQRGGGGLGGGAISTGEIGALLVLALGLCALYAFVRRRRKAATGNPPYGRLDDRWLARRQARE